MKYFFYDLETTGLHYETDKIHQIGVIIYSNGKILEKANIKFGVQEIGFKSLISLLDRHVDKFNKSDKFHLAGWNIMGFDNNFLRTFFDRNGNKFFGSYFYSDCIDVMPLASNYLRNKRSTMEDFKLGIVAKKLGIKVDDSKLHDALYDTEITRQIYKKINK